MSEQVLRAINVSPLDGSDDTYRPYAVLVDGRLASKIRNLISTLKSVPDGYQLKVFTDQPLWVRLFDEDLSDEIEEGRIKSVADVEEEQLIAVNAPTLVVTDSGYWFECELDGVDYTSDHQEARELPPL